MSKSFNYRLNLMRVSLVGHIAINNHLITYGDISVTKANNIKL